MALTCLLISVVVILFDSAYCENNGFSPNNEDILGLKNEVKSLREEMTKYKSIIDVLLEVRTMYLKNVLSINRTCICLYQFLRPIGKLTKTLSSAHSRWNPCHFVDGLIGLRDMYGH